MNKFIPLSLAPLALFAAAAFAQGVSGPADVETKLRAAGYTDSFASVEEGVAHYVKWLNTHV